MNAESTTRIQAWERALKRRVKRTHRTQKRCLQQKRRLGTRTESDVTSSQDVETKMEVSNLVSIIPALRDKSDLDEVCSLFYFLVSEFVINAASYIERWLHPLNLYFYQDERALENICQTCFIHWVYWLDGFAIEPWLIHSCIRFQVTVIEETIRFITRLEDAVIEKHFPQGIEASGKSKRWHWLINH